MYAETELKTFESDFDYINNVIDGMESLVFQDDEYSRYNRALVMGILESRGVKTTTVEGTEGFVQWFKELIEKVWKSIKDFFKGIWEGLTNSKAKEELKGKNRFDPFDGGNAFKYQSTFASNQSAFEDLDKTMKEGAKRFKEWSKNFKAADAEQLNPKMRNMGETIEREVNQMPHEENEKSDLRKWLDSRKKRRATSQKIYDLAADQWKVLDRETDAIRGLLKGVSDDMPRAEQQKKRQELNLAKEALQRQGRYCAMVMDYALKNAKLLNKEEDKLLLLEDKSGK